MNIFVLDQNPVKAAQYLCDSHVVKMALESAQILCTVSWECDVSAPYKATHKKHPVVIWACKTLSNYNWLLEHAFAICNEYRLRYNGRIHASQSVVEWCSELGGRPDMEGLTPFAQAMPEKYRKENAVEAYRGYYLGEKKKFAKWSMRDIPDWWVE